MALVVVLGVIQAAKTKTVNLAQIHTLVQAPHLVPPFCPERIHR